MHHGDEVFITKSGKYYHYFDDDCPTSSSILKGKKDAQKVKEEEAKEMGLTLCKHCAKEYEEDMKERQGCAGASVLFIGAAVASVEFFAYVIGL
ncbi:hypothetical protein [Pontibacillus marinus]|uniref:DNA mismatch repair protein MutS-like N-terminal domain-containing protein n=1 Tax=Pontibacillus marinus BH030004 = DSM 16465 TaxID=1385511 RepID=A0A0A5G964_9BACI|nr:hypothetical protein [Pontibacillus marinus]KGX89696.1 hypothetical protein N783_04775 [Pontibacillus marinus BH030004 = DSM 16465]